MKEESEKASAFPGIGSQRGVPRAIGCIEKSFLVIVFSRSMYNKCKRQGEMGAKHPTDKV